MKTRILSMMIAIVMIVSMIPASVMTANAAETAPDAPNANNTEGFVYEFACNTDTSHQITAVIFDSTFSEAGEPVKNDAGEWTAEVTHKVKAAWDEWLSRIYSNGYPEYTHAPKQELPEALTVTYKWDSEKEKWVLDGETTTYDISCEEPAPAEPVGGLNCNVADGIFEIRCEAHYNGDGLSITEHYPTGFATNGEVTKNAEGKWICEVTVRVKDTFEQNYFKGIYKDHVAVTELPETEVFTTVWDDAEEKWTWPETPVYEVTCATETTHNVKVSTVDTASGSDLAGATLQIIDSEGTVIEEWVSTTEAHKIVGLNAEETHTLRVVNAPAGYTLPADAEFSIDAFGYVTSTGSCDEDGTLLVEFNYTAVKVSAVNTASGSDLAGATLHILDSEGNVAEEWVSSTAAREIIGLNIGEAYTLHVAVAPDGYSIPADIIFSLDEIGNVSSTGAIDADGVILIIFEPASASAPVASVTIGGTTTNHTTLADAIAAVASCTASDNAKITILTDIDQGDSYATISSGVFTIDLNGKEISTTSSKVGGGSLEITGGTVTIMDSATGGKITGGTSGVRVDNADLTVTGGTFTGVEVGLIAFSGTLEITGGTFTSTASNGHGIDSNDTTVKISGGTFRANVYGAYLHGAPSPSAAVNS